MKIIEWYKNFKYKGVTGLSLLIIFSILNTIFFNPVIMWLTFFSFTYMLTYTFCYIFAGIKNYKKEGHPILGTLLQILAIGFVLVAINALSHFIFNY
jgi:hypothetical protein